MRAATIGTTLVLTALVITFGSAPAQAQFSLGGGATFQGGLFLGDANLRFGNFGLSLDLGAKTQTASEGDASFSVGLGIASLLVKWYVPFGDFPVVPYVGAGGIAVSVGFAGSNAGESASVTGTGSGGQIALGAEWQPLNFPIVLYGAGHSATIETVTVTVEANGESQSVEQPIQGVGGLSFSVGLRWDFISIRPEPEAPVEVEESE